MSKLIFGIGDFVASLKDIQHGNDDQRKAVFAKLGGHGGVSVGEALSMKLPKSPEEWTKKHDNALLALNEESDKSFKRLKEVKAKYFNPITQGHHSSMQKDSAYIDANKKYSTVTKHFDYLNQGRVSLGIPWPKD